ncbi:MAG: hypothetical protein ACFKPT_05110 [Gloeotrichia echinulata GP01]
MTKIKPQDVPFLGLKYLTTLLFLIEKSLSASNMKDKNLGFMSKKSGYYYSIFLLNSVQDYHRLLLCYGYMEPKQTPHSAREEGGVSVRFP